ncbi:hypothetical protein FACS189425_04860 [Clostridia bacterium]|nr:hypothetical protein FACS189425_04860 [Clostridia bacterium]
MTLYELKEKMATLSAQIAADAEYIAEKGADPTTLIEDIDKKAAHRDELVKRRTLLKNHHDEIEAAQREQMEKQQKTAHDDDPKKAKKALRGDFYKAAFGRGDLKKAYSGLGAIPSGSADLGYGENFLPTNMSNRMFADTPAAPYDVMSFCAA